MYALMINHTAKSAFSREETLDKISAASVPQREK
jgi:hypothetical protein